MGVGLPSRRRPGRRLLAAACLLCSTAAWASHLGSGHATGGWLHGSDVDVGPCNIPTADESDLTPADFQRLEGPIIVRRSASSSRALEHMTAQCDKSSLLSFLGNSSVALRFPFANLSPSGTEPLADHIHSWLPAAGTGDHSCLTSAPQVSPYFFAKPDTKSAQWKTLMAKYDSALVDKYAVGSEITRSFGVGARCSGLSFHFHGTAFAETLVGRKRWWLYPPHRHPGNDWSSGPAGWYQHFLNQTGTERSDMEADLFQCTLQPGQVLYVPAGWWHSTMNVDETVFVSSLAKPSNHRIIDIKVGSWLPEVSDTLGWSSSSRWLHPTGQFRVLVLSNSEGAAQLALSIAVQLTHACVERFQVVLLEARMEAVENMMLKAVDLGLDEQITFAHGTPKDYAFGDTHTGQQDLGLFDYICVGDYLQFVEETDRDVVRMRMQQALVEGGGLGIRLAVPGNPQSRLEEGIRFRQLLATLQSTENQSSTMVDSPYLSFDENYQPSLFYGLVTSQGDPNYGGDITRAGATQAELWAQLQQQTRLASTLYDSMTSEILPDRPMMSKEKMMRNTFQPGRRATMQELTATELEFAGWSRPALFVGGNYLPNSLPQTVLEDFASAQLGVAGHAETAFAFNPNLLLNNPTFAYFRKASRESDIARPMSQRCERYDVPVLAPVDWLPQDVDGRIHKTLRWYGLTGLAETVRSWDDCAQSINEGRCSIPLAILDQVDGDRNLESIHIEINRAIVSGTQLSWSQFCSSWSETQSVFGGIGLMHLLTKVKTDVHSSPCQYRVNASIVFDY